MTMMSSRNKDRSMAMANRLILPWLYAFIKPNLRFWLAVLALAFSTAFFVSIAVLKSTFKIIPSLPAGIIHPSPCRDAPEGYVLHERGICTDTCGKLCFPRVHGVCFGHSQVTICDRRPVPEEIKVAGGIPPSIMRFHMDHNPRKKVPVRYGECPNRNATGIEWILGLHMVADLTLMPTGKVGPNPHHESEKIIPAILFTHRYGLENSTLYWFADPKDALMISKWSLGLLDVFSDKTKVGYLRPAGRNENNICFEDVILFARATNSEYIPNQEDHNWLRKRILKHCAIPAQDANRPVQHALAIHRPNSVRNIANYDAVKEVIEQELRVSMKVFVTGASEFCDQVKDVAQADVILTPHGSQNVNLVVSRPGALVLEAFPFLYYIDWYSHFLHAGRVMHYELYGTAGEDGDGMSLRMQIYSLIYGWKKCFYARHCMNYGKGQPIYVDLGQLRSILQTLISRCSLIVKDSYCI